MISLPLNLLGRVFVFRKMELSVMQPQYDPARQGAFCITGSLPEFPVTQKSAPELGTDHIRPQPPCFPFETSTKRQRTPTYPIPITGNNRGNLLDAVLHFVSGSCLKKRILMKRSASLLGDDLQNRPTLLSHRHSSL